MYPLYIQIVSWRDETQNWLDVIYGQMVLPILLSLFPAYNSINHYVGGISYIII